MIPGLIRESSDFERQRERKSSSRYLITKVKDNSSFHKVFHVFEDYIDFKLSNMSASECLFSIFR